jgi:hypothetical protein
MLSRRLADPFGQIKDQGIKLMGLVWLRQGRTSFARFNTRRTVRRRINCLRRLEYFRTPVYSSHPES